MRTFRPVACWMSGILLPLLIAGMAPSTQAAALQPGSIPTGSEGADEELDQIFTQMIGVTGTPYDIMQNNALGLDGVSVEALHDLFVSAEMTVARRNAKTAFAKFVGILNPSGTSDSASTGLSAVAANGNVTVVGYAHLSSNPIIYTAITATGQMPAAADGSGSWPAQVLGGFPSGSTYAVLNAISIDGNTAIGRVDDSSYSQHPFVVSLPGGLPQALTPPTGVSSGEVVAMTPDAAVLAGDNPDPLGSSGHSIARYTLRGDRQYTAQNIGIPPGSTTAYVAGLSADGSTIIGESIDASYVSHALVWTAAGGFVDPGAGAPAGSTDGQAYQATANGTYVIGFGALGVYGYVWSQSGGMGYLGSLTGLPYSVPECVSADGCFIGGGCDDASFTTGTATIWTSSGQIYNLLELLEAVGVSLPGWTLNEVTGIVANGDGTYLFSGNGTLNGVAKAFVVQFGFNAASLPGFYFGTIGASSSSSSAGSAHTESRAAASGLGSNFAAEINSAGTGGVLIGYISSINAGFSVSFTLSSSGTFSATTNSLTGGASPSQPLTFTGSVASGTISGTIAPLSLPFSAAVDASTGSSAAVSGFYQAAAGSSGGTYSVVGTQGEVFALTVTPAGASAGVGTVTGSAFTVTTQNGATVAGTVVALSDMLSGTITPAAGGSVTSFSGSTAAPVFSVSPQAETVATGRSAAFNAAANGSPAYQWTFGGAPISGATDPILLVGNTTLASAGSYVCVATNGLGSTTSTAAALAVTATSNPGRLINLSARANVGTGNNILIGGFGVSGAGTKQLLVRGVGPALSVFFNTDLVTPQLVLLDNGGAVVATNIGWGNAPVAGASTASEAPTTATTNLMNSLGAYAIAAGSADTATVLTMPAGNNTAQLSGVAGTTGIALCEIYDADLATPTAHLINISARADVGTGNSILIGGFAIGGPERSSPRSIPPVRRPEPARPDPFDRRRHGDFQQYDLGRRCDDRRHIRNDRSLHPESRPCGLRPARHAAARQLHRAGQRPERRHRHRPL